MGKGLIILSALFIIALARGGAGQRITTSPTVLSPENSILITDHPTKRLIRVRDLSSTGVETGPTASGLSFNGPWHFSLDASGRIYVADQFNNRIVRMDDFTGSGWKAFSGVGSNTLVQPRSVAVDAAGKIYIVDSMSRIVRIDDMNGAGWTSTPAPGPGRSTAPKVLIFDQQGRFVVSDTDGHRIVRFNDMNLSGWTTFGSKGNGPGQFYRPEGLAIDSFGRIYITDNENHRIVRINDMTGAGWVTLGSGLLGSEVGQFNQPHDVKVDSGNRIWIADTGNHRIVRVNDMTGAGWIAFGISGDPNLQLNAPKGIHVLGLGPTLAYTSVLPQIMVGGGHSTSVIAINTGTESSEAEVSFTKSDGTSFPLTVDGLPASTFNRTIVPMGSTRLEATSAENLARGYATLRSREALNGFALVKTVAGNTIMSEASVALSPPMKTFTVHIDNSNNARSGYVVVNFGAVWLQLNLTLRNKSGFMLETSSVNLAPGQYFTEFASERFSIRAPAGFEGSIEFSSRSGNAVVSDGPGWRVGAVGLRYDNSTSDVFTTIPVIANATDPFAPHDPDFPPLPVNSPTTLYYPLVVDGGTYRTTLVLVNTMDAATTATVDFFASDGTSLSLPIEGVPRTSYTLPLSAKGVARIVTDGTSSAMKVGWARVTSPSPVGALEVFQRVVDGRIVSGAGVSSSPLARRLTTYVDTVGSAESELAVCNPNNFNVAVTFHLRNSSGQIVASTTRTLTAFAHMRNFVTQLFPTGYEEFEGTLELLTSGASVSALALRYDNPGGTVFAGSPVFVISTPEPMVNPGGTVNGASFAPGAPVAAGGIASVFGLNLASFLPEGTSVRFGGAPAFLFDVFPRQINLQVPWEVSGQSQTSLTVTVDGLTSTPVTVNLATFSPGIFVLGPSGQGAILIASTGEMAAPRGSIPGLAARPVNRGEYITIYCTGLGPVTNRPASGERASANPLSVTTTASRVTIGGVATPMTDGFFSGLAPGFVGLYQVNVLVPQNAPTGDAIPLALSIGGITSNTVPLAVQ